MPIGSGGGGKPERGTGDEFDRKPLLMIHRGLDLAHPPDMLEDGFLPLAKNIRAYVEGRLETRPGLTELDPAQHHFHTTGHSIFRFDDPVAGDYNYFVGTDIQVKIGKTSLLAITPGSLSGNPWTSFVFRPDRFGNPLIYIADTTSYFRYKVDGSAWQWGFTPINEAPVGLTAPPALCFITDTDVVNPTVNPEAGLVWNLNGGAGPVTRVNRIAPATISQIVFDQGTNGYCNIVPSTLTGTEYQAGMRILIDESGPNQEYVYVERVFPAIRSARIQEISYDSGLTGMCTIVLDQYSTGLVPETLIVLNTEYVIVRAVIDGPGHRPALRCSTTGIHVSGEPVTGVRNFRCLVYGTHAIGQALTSYGYQWAFAAGGIQHLAHNVTRDLGSFLPPVAFINTADDDEVVVAIYISDMSLLVEGRVQFCVDPQVTTAYAPTTDYTRDYYYFPFRTGDLQDQASAASKTQIANATIVQQRSYLDTANVEANPSGRYIDPITQRPVTGVDLNARIAEILGSDIPEPRRSQLLKRIREQVSAGGAINTSGEGIWTATIPTSTDPQPFQIGTGNERWYQLRFKIGSMIRVGNDSTRTLRDCTSIRFTFNVTAAVTVGVAQCHIYGGFGPDTLGDYQSNGRAYYYRVVGRNSQTGEVTAPSPPMRTGIVSRRRQIRATITPYADPQIDKLDWYRFGGTLFQWTYLASVDNTAFSVFPSPSGKAELYDELSDTEIENNPILDFGRLQPFAVADLPRRGRCNVIGNKVTRVSGDNFNTSWGAGVEMTINGATYTLFRQPNSTTALELAQSGWAATNVPWEIPSPIILGRKLGVVFGPFGQGQTGLYFFAVGDTVNPGTVYWLNPNDPNSHNDQNYLQVTDESDPLIGGLIYDGRPYLWSAGKMFYLQANFNPQLGETIFTSQEIANSRGAWYHLAICVDVLMYFVGKDGVYESEGGQPRNITNKRLYPLFPHDGQPGTDIVLGSGIIKAPDFTRPTSFRLYTDGEFVRFIYQATDATWHMLLYEKIAERWFYDVYGDLDTFGVGGLQVLHVDRGKQEYGMVGLTHAGSFVRFAGVLDALEAIETKLLMPALNGGDPRAIKNFGDYTLDIDSDGASTAIVPWFDNYSSSGPAQANTNVTRGLSIYETNLGDERLAINMGLELTHPGSLAGARLQLWEWHPAWVMKTENTQRRATDWESLSDSGNVFLQGLLIEADTGGVDKTVQVVTENGVVATLTMNHPRQSTKPYVIDPPVIASQVRLLPTDQDNWRVYQVDWIHEPTPESVSIWQSPPLAHGLAGWQFIREIWLTITSTDIVTVLVNIDGVNQPAITTPSTAGVMTTRYLSFHPVKGKLFSYRVTSPAPFQLFETDSWVMVGAWARAGEEPLLRSQPFGMKASVGRESAAMI